MRGAVKITTQDGEREETIGEGKTQKGGERNRRKEKTVEGYTERAVRGVRELQKVKRQQQQ